MSIASDFIKMQLLRQKGPLQYDVPAEFWSDAAGLKRVRWSRARVSARRARVPVCVCEFNFIPKLI